MSFLDSGLPVIERNRGAMAATRPDAVCGGARVALLAGVV